MADRVVKIEGEILGELEKFISKNKYEFSSVRQAINLAVLEFLKSKSFIKNKGVKK
jgi:hypothetical protein